MNVPSRAAGLTARLRGVSVELIQRVAALGLAAILWGAGLFAIGAATVTTDTLSHVSKANALNGLYEKARYNVGAEESLERKYRLEPSPDVRAAHRASEISLEETMRAVARIGDSSDRAVVATVLPAHKKYVLATHSMFAAVDARRPTLALRLDHDDIDPVLTVVEQSVYDRAALQRDQTNIIIARLNGLQRRVIEVTIALSICSIVFLSAYFGVLQVYKRRLEAAHAAEVQALEDATLIDHLTNTGNHRAYKESFRREASRAARHGETLSLALIDVDDLKVLNDQNGHMHGDRVLVAVGSMLRAQRVEDLPFRLGGDEFALLLPNTWDRDAALYMERLRKLAEDGLLGATISIGIASLEGATCDPETLQAQADAALYAAKRAGRNSVVSFNEAIDGMWLLSPAKVQQLRNIIADRNVGIAFQPIWDVETCSILAYEALARPAERYGFPGPQDMFDLAERVGRAHEIDAVCRQATLRHAKELLSEEVLLFINVSPQSLDHGRLNVRQLCDEVEAAGLTPQRIVIELTERSVAQLSVVIRAAKELQHAGFRLALDDTGAGNAGLEMLSQLPVDFVKIDREIIVKAMTDRSARGVMAGILAIARETGAYVIAEGIEDVGMLDLVCSGAIGAKRVRGVQGVQGYLLQRPSEAAAPRRETARIEALLQKARLRRSLTNANFANSGARDGENGAFGVPHENIGRSVR